MEIRCEKSGGALCVILEGRLDSAGAMELSDALKARLEEQDRAVVFDMAGVPYLSSAGIRVLFSCEKEMKRRDGTVCLCAVSSYVRNVLEITGFHRVFPLCRNRGEGLALCRAGTVPDENTPTAAVPEHISGNARLSAIPVPGVRAVLRITGSAGTGSPPGTADLIGREFRAGEYSAGAGALGASAGDALAHLGDLLTLGNIVFHHPRGSRGVPDFLVPGPGAPEIILHTAYAVSLDGPFHEIVTVEPVGPGGIELGDIWQGIAASATERGIGFSGVFAAVMLAETGGGDGARERRSGPVGQASGNGGTAGEGAGTKTLVAFGTCADAGSSLPGADTAVPGGFPGGERDRGRLVYQMAAVYPGPLETVAGSLRDAIDSVTREGTCLDLVLLHPSTVVTRAMVGVSYISGIVDTGEAAIRISGEAPGWNEAFEAIARRLNPDCREIELSPLTGGYSGTLVFRVQARDRKGRRMMPLVMKLGNWPLIEAEIRGYSDHVRRYIQNNATQIIQQERIGDSGGILYNFVGIKGAESRITSLEEFYRTHSCDEILPVLDSLFRVVLRGWYGQPRLKEMPLYAEYGTFWQYDRIREYARSRFGANSGDERIILPFDLGESTNPIWFVETILNRRQAVVSTVYEASVHGDLNLKNILMDEEKNLWLIDFAETRYSHILRDIVKLEAVLKGEMSTIRSDEMLRELVLLDRRFLGAGSLSEIPSLPPVVDDPELEKAFRCVQRLRKYADLVTLLDDDFHQYLIGLLPYTLSMISYASVNHYTRKFAWCSASLCCERLMEKEPNDP
jgi:anti-anti-sigma factor